MNLTKIAICKEIFDVAKDAYSNSKHGSGGQSGYSNHYGYGAPSYCHCRHGGGKSNGGPMQIISSLKNSKQLKSLPQTLQGLASLKHGGGNHGSVKKILPQVLKGIKSRMH